MKTLVTTLGVCLALAVGTAAMQNPPPTPQTPKPVPEANLVGCLIQGSAPNVFLFDNAKNDPKDTAEKGVRYVVVADPNNVNLRMHLNHEVRISGIPENKPTPLAGQKLEEKDLPKLSATRVAMVSATCSVAVN